jgi:hypothetical protein
MNFLAMFFLCELGGYLIMSLGIIYPCDDHDEQNPTVNQETFTPLQNSLSFAGCYT